MKPLGLAGAANYRGRFPFTSRSDGLLILARKNFLDCRALRLGVVIPNRVCPRAVDRNRLRRVIRETIRKELSHKGNLDVIVRVRNLVPKSSHKVFVHQLLMLLRKLRS